jgi:hypothetical protein
MTPNSFEDIAAKLVEDDRERAQFQARDIAERLAQGSRLFDSEGAQLLRKPYTLQEARQAMRARDALIAELLKG